MSEKDLVKQMERMKLRRHKSTPCMFQNGKHLHTIDEAKERVHKLDSDKTSNQQDPTDDTSESVDNDKQGSEEKKNSEQFPKLVSQLRTKMHSNTFITRTRAAVARRRRLERPWMKGNEMRPFYHLWEQEQSTPKGRKLRRVSSLPGDYRMPEVVRKPADVGIVRECCSKIRSRLKTFPFD